MNTPADTFRDELIELVRKHIRTCDGEHIVDVLDEIQLAVENDEFEGAWS